VLVEQHRHDDDDANINIRDQRRVAEYNGTDDDGHVVARDRHSACNDSLDCSADHRRTDNSGAGN
jgi:hypothetical protein